MGEGQPAGAVCCKAMRCFLVVAVGAVWALEVRRVGSLLMKRIDGTVRDITAQGSRHGKHATVNTARLGGTSIGAWEHGYKSKGRERYMHSSGIRISSSPLPSPHDLIDGWMNESYQLQV